MTCLHPEEKQDKYFSCRLVDGKLLLKTPCCKFVNTVKQELQSEDNIIHRANNLEKMKGSYILQLKVGNICIHVVALSTAKLSCNCLLNCCADRRNPSCIAFGSVSVKVIKKQKMVCKHIFSACVGVFPFQKMKF